ncbi:hypothetical protein M514_11218 [Trichuris suis]|uniref:G-protein coupled receptors family 1 profile domain-containing protein n=1 Tax=Trichuris suis TaxID=68888 RepID=A0A085NEV2_9BILA|nr:hypothetical protein M513_11218 [Trichuris suis]KFD67998.1 hypothetical protein M514_11218 [Trichuris suis]
MFDIGEKLESIIIVIIGVDRLMAIVNNELYRKFTTKHLMILLSISVLLLLCVHVALIFHDCATKRRSVSSQCFDFEVFPTDFLLFHQWTVVIAPYISIVLYIVIYSYLWCNRSSECAVRSIQMKREVLVLKRLTFLIISSFLFYALPLSVVLCCQDVIGALDVYIWSLASWTLATQVLIYCWFNKEINKAVKALLKLQQCRGRKIEPSCSQVNLANRTTMFQEE